MSRCKLMLKLSAAILVCAILLTGCAGQIKPSGWASPSVHGNTLYGVSQKNGEFLAIDLSSPNSPPDDLTPRIEKKSSGLLGCQASAKSELICYGTPVIADGVAYIGAYDGKVYAVNTTTKAEIWARPVETDGPIVADPLLQGTSLIIASGSKLYAINAQNGAFLWSRPFKADGKIWSNPVLNGEQIIFGSLGHKLYSVDLKTGQLKWEKHYFGGPVASTPLIVDGIIYIGASDSKFYAIDAETGALNKWNEPFAAGDWFWSRAAYFNGTIYVGSMDHHVYAIDAETGLAKPTWGPPLLEGPIRSAAIVVDDVLMVTSTADNGTVYGLNPETGQVKWRSRDLGKIYADPWVVGSTVYYLNRNDDLYALDAMTGNVSLIITLDRN